jgi:hypothetical protein
LNRKKLNDLKDVKNIPGPAAFHGIFFI